MSEIMDFLSGSVNPLNMFKVLKHNVLFARNNPDYFYPSGIWVFCGPQGNGKTLSAIQCLKEMCKQYPKAMVCTNLDIDGIENKVVKFTDYEQLKTLDNGIYGIIFFLDEIPILWNSLESKDIPISEMACFCQMRKNRRVILGTAQVYSRIAKPIREQLQYAIDCKIYLGCIQVNTILDPSESIEKNGNIGAKVVGKKIWFHRPELYNSYDTLFKIERANRNIEKRRVKNNG